MSHAEPFYHLSTGISIGLAGPKCPIGPQLPHVIKPYIILCVERKKMVDKLQPLVIIQFIKKKSKISKIQTDNNRGGVSCEIWVSRANFKPLRTSTPPDSRLPSLILCSNSILGIEAYVDG